MSRTDTRRPRANSLISRIAAELVQHIHEGELGLGARLPSVRQYARERGVSNETVLRTYDKLVAQGYLEARRGSGFYVRRSKPQPAETGRRWTDMVSAANPWQRLLHREDVLAASGPGSGSLPADWMDREALADALRALRAVSPAVLAEYGQPHGYLPLRQQVQLKLQEQDIQALPSQIIATSGAADALHLAIWANFFPGDYVIVEDPASFMHVQRLLASGLQIVRVPRLADGPDLDVLQALCEEHKPRAFLCSSVLQNPTSTSLSAHKAYQILKMAEAFNLLVIDDDTYGALQPPSGSHVARLAALDQFERVIHIGSFSKTIAPGLRSGFLAASAAQVERILLYKSVGAIQSPLLTEVAVSHILAQGRYRHHCERLRGRLDAVRASVREALAGLGCEVSRDTLGMYLWVSLGEGRDAAPVAAALAAHGCPAAPGSIFSSARAARSCMRLNVSGVQPPHLDMLAELLRS